MSTKFECKICGLENPEPKHYWKIHKIREADYYIQYYNKKDLLTGESINFKNREQYILTDFNTKTNLKKWLISQTIDIQKEYLKDILLRRKQFKNLVYIPTQTELRSMDNMLGISSFNTVVKDYYKFSEDLGFVNKKFNNINGETIIKTIRDIKYNTIIIDTREQNHINFKDLNIEIDTLPYGDYTVKENNYNIYIERKSLNDFISTCLPSNIERFKRELTRAKENGAYIIMLVETSLSKALGFEYNTRIAQYSQANSGFIFHNLRELLQEFDNFQAAFCNGRGEMSKIIEKIFETGDFWKYHDVQLGIDLKLFNNSI